MAAATSFVSPSVYTFAALFPLSPSLSLSLFGYVCVFLQVPQSDLNAAIPFELIPKVTFDFRYDFSHFHMAPH